MNLVKEKLWSASNRRYVWDMHPEKRPFKGRPWGPEGHSDWAMHLSSYQEWHGEVWLWAWVRIQQAEQRPQSASQQCQSCASWCMAFIVAYFFVCSELPDKQTNKQTLCGLGGMQAPHSWPFAIRTSHAENSRFYVKKKEKKAKHKNSNNCKVWVVFECGGRHNCFWCTSWEEMTMRLKCLLRRFI